MVVVSAREWVSSGGEWWWQVCWLSGVAETITKYN